tara:strand:- start:37 stop:234 length:198 start_codon:yes stop_codon:yes gene_type:complete
MSLFGNIKENIISDLFDDDLQAELVKALNDNVDIPFLSEKTEEKIFNAIYESVEGVIKAVLMKKL